MASIFEQFMAGRQMAQQQALNQLKLQQANQLFPIEQQLRQLQLQREQQALSQQQQMAPIQIEQAELDLEQQRALLDQGLLGMTADQREFAELTKDLTDEDIVRARRIKLGLDPRAVGSAIQTITEKGTVKEVGATEKEIASAKEEGKLISQLKLEPEIERKVTSVIAAAKADADSMANEKSDSAAFNLYQTAFSGLSTALGQTTTGPIFGLMPAITSKQQIAEGAIAAVAPILKQLFRTAGEGTFTDKDQELLLKMVPTRTDTAESSRSKMINIDSIVRAKLKQPLVDNFDEELPQPIPGSAKSGGQVMIDANGNRAIVYPDGTFEEL